MCVVFVLGQHRDGMYRNHSRLIGKDYITSGIGYELSHNVLRCINVPVPSAPIIVIIIQSRWKVSV